MGKNLKSVNEEWKKSLVLEDGILALIDKNDLFNAQLGCLMNKL